MIKHQTDRVCNELGVIMILDRIAVLITRAGNRSGKDLRLAMRRHERLPAIGLIAAGTLIMFLMGCAIGPNYVKPTSPVPDAYKEMDGWKVAHPGGNTVRGPWWEAFGDDELNALESQVNISNQNVLMMEAQFRQARSLIQAAQAAYFPTVTAGAAFARTQRSGSSSQSSGASGSLSSDYLLPVNVSWELDLWGRIRRTSEAAKASAEASAADLEAARLSSQAELALAYFQLRILDTERQLLDATTAAYERSFELTRNQYESGIVSRTDMLQAETQLKTTRAQAIDIGVQRAQLEHAIALLTGKPASSFSIPVEKPVMTPPDIPVGIPSELLERRPDIAAAERRVAAANARVGIALTAFFPTGHTWRNGWIRKHKQWRLAGMAKPLLGGRANDNGNHFRWGFEKRFDR